MAQHLREGSEVNITYEDSGGTVTLSAIPVTNMTDAYIEVASALAGTVVVPWARVYRIAVTTD